MQEVYEFCKSKQKLPEKTKTEHIKQLEEDQKKKYKKKGKPKNTYGEEDEEQYPKNTYGDEDEKQYPEEEDEYESTLKL